MSIDIETAIFGLMGQAKELQEQSIASQNELRNAARYLPEALKSEIRREMNNSLGDEAKTALRALQAATEAAKENSAAMKSTTQKAWLVHIAALIGAAVVVGMVGYAVTGITLKNRLAELDELKSQIVAEKSTLVQLQSETWKLELVKYQDGSRGIILPKGVTVDRTGALTDKSGRIGIVIKP